MIFTYPHERSLSLSKENYTTSIDMKRTQHYIFIQKSFTNINFYEGRFYNWSNERKLQNTDATFEQNMQSIESAFKFRNIGIKVK